MRTQTINGLVAGKGALAADAGQLNKGKGYHEQPQLDLFGSRFHTTVLSAFWFVIYTVLNDFSAIAVMFLLDSSRYMD